MEPGHGRSSRGTGGTAALESEPCPTSCFPVRSCPPTDASAAARRRCAPRSSRRWSARGAALLGTSHRQAPVKDLVGQVRAQPRRAVPPSRRLRGHRRQRRIDRVLGCRGLRPDREAAARTSCSASSAASSPPPRRRRGSRRPTSARSPAGTRTTAEPVDGVDVYAWPHNETSTGVSAPIARVHGDEGALTVIDATSAAGGIDFSVHRDRRLLLRAAEEPRLGRRPVVRASSRPPRSSGSSGSRHPVGTSPSS